MATILLLEPHPLLRLGLRHLLAQAHMPGDLVDIDPAAVHDPDPWTSHADLLIYGLPADATAGWQSLAEVCRQLLPQRVLVLADQVPPTLPETGLPDAVRGLMSKTCSSDALDAAVRLVLAGGECFPSQLQAARWAEPTGTPPGLHAAASTAAARDARHAAAPIVVPLHSVVAADMLPVAQARAVPVETPSAGAHLLNITERQYEVLTLLARGYPIKTVSRLLNISVATAKTHACTLYQRLHVRNKGEAVYVALQRGASLNWPGPAPVKPASTHVSMSAAVLAARESSQESCEAA